MCRNMNFISSVDKDISQVEQSKQVRYMYPVQHEK